MSEQVQLHELSNNLLITGTLKEKNLQKKPTKKGDLAIMGNLVISVVDGDKVNEIRVEIFAKATSGLFKGYQTVLNEYKASVDYPDNPTRVTVKGTIEMNDYTNASGQLISRNRYKGVFVNREDKPEVKDQAVAKVEMVVQGFEDATDREGNPTGDIKVKGFTVGYEGRNVIELKNLIMAEKIGSQIQQAYSEGDTGVLNLKIQHYTVVEQKQTDDDLGFGEDVDVEVAETYVNELRIIGGRPPHFGDTTYTQEQIQQASRQRALAIEEAKNAVPATPPANTQSSDGFGTDPFSNDGSIDISDDDLPF